MTVPSIERLGAGVMRRIVGAETRPQRPPAAAEDYEAILTPIYAWLHAVAQGAAPGRGRGLQGGSVRGWRALTGAAGRRGLRGRSIAAAWPLADRGAQPRRPRPAAAPRSPVRRCDARGCAGWTRSAPGWA